MAKTDAPAADGAADEPEGFGDETAEPGTELVASFGGVSFPITITDTPEAIQQRILARLFQAESLDDAFGVWESTTSDALVGKAYEVSSVRWGTYEAEHGTIPLAEVHGADLATGEDTSFVTTATNLTGFLALCDSRGWLPVRVRIGGQRTKRGQTVLVPERV